VCKCTRRQENSCYGIYGVCPRSWVQVGSMVCSILWSAFMEQFVGSTGSSQKYGQPINWLISQLTVGFPGQENDLYLSITAGDSWWGASSLFDKTRKDNCSRCCRVWRASGFGSTACVVWIEGFCHKKPLRASHSKIVASHGPALVFGVLMCIPELLVVSLNCSQFGEVYYCECCGLVMLSQCSEQKMRNLSI